MKIFTTCLGHNEACGLFLMSIPGQGAVEIQFLSDDDDDPRKLVLMRGKGLKSQNL